MRVLQVVSPPQSSQSAGRKRLLTGLTPLRTIAGRWMIIERLSEKSETVANRRPGYRIAILFGSSPFKLYFIKNLIRLML